MPFKFKKYLKFIPLSILIFNCLLIYQADSPNFSFIKVNAMDYPYGDKIGHLVLFGTLAFTTALFTNYRLRKWGFLQMNILVWAILFFAIIEEFSQIFIERRNFEVLDLMCNFIGITGGNILANYLKTISWINTNLLNPKKI